MSAVRFAIYTNALKNKFTSGLKAFAVRGSLCLLAGLSALLSPRAHGAHQEAGGLSKDSILLVSSFNAQSKWGEGVVEGFLSRFDDGKYSVSKIELGVLNNKGLEVLDSDVAWIAEKFEQRRAATIVALDQDAIDLVFENRDKFPKGVKIILGGDVAYGSVQRELHSNVFAINKRIDLQRNLNLGRKLFPGAKKVIILTPGDREGFLLHSAFKGGGFDAGSLDVELVNGREFSTREMLEIVERGAREKAFVILFSWVSLKDQERLPINVATHIVMEASGLRILSAFTSNSDVTLGGYMEDAEELGAYIGAKTREIADKEDFTKTSFEAPAPRLAINWALFRQAERSTKLLPLDAEYYNIPPSLLGMAEFRYFAGILSLAALALAFLFFLLARALRTQRRHLEVFKSMAADVYVFDADGAIHSSYSEYGEVTYARNISIFGEEFEKFFRETGSRLPAGREAALEFVFQGVPCKGVVRRMPKDRFGAGAFMLTITDVSDLAAVRRNFHDTVKKFHDTNSFLNVLIDNIPCGIFVKNYSDRDKYIIGNKFFRHNLARHPENIDGRSDFDIFDPETARACIRDDRTVVDGGELLDGIKTLRAKDGTVTTCHTIKTSMRMENGDVYLFGICMDITELLLAQEKMRAHSEQMRVLNECLHSALLAENSKDFAADIIGFVGRSLSADRCYFVKYDDTRGKLEDISEWVAEPSLARREDLIDTPIPDLGVWIEKFRAGGVIKSENISADSSPEFANAALVPEFSGVNSYLAVGVQREGRVLGFITVEFLDAARKTSDLDESLMRTASRILEIVIERFENISRVAESEHMRSIVLDSIDIPIMLLDSKRNLISANSAASEFTGFAQDIMLSKPCHETICKGMYNDETCPVLKCISSGKMVSNDFITPSGKEYHTIITPIFDKEKRLKYVVEYLLDMTEFNEGKRLLVKAMQEAQAADKAKSYFIATMSHELRTPLNAVIGYTELTQNPDLGQDERMHNLKNINFAANALLNLINDILDLSKLEAGQMEIFKSPLSMVFVAEEFLRIFKFSANKKGVYLKMDVQKNFPLLMLDILRLKQVLMNVIGNAVKFTEKGGIDVKFSYETVSEDEADLRITVSDTGIGIAPEFIKKIFNPFEQDVTGRTRGRGSYEGTGLGMPIVKRLVEKMGGEISVDSEINRGSRFNILFRGVEISEGAQANLPEDAEAKEEPKLAEKLDLDLTVMVLDDILLNVKVLRKMLSNLGFSVLESLSAIDALAIVKKQRPDVIMTDLWMPEMSGHEFAKAVRDDPQISSIPIIAVTADTQVQDPDGLFDEILFKPITTKAIDEKIKKVILKCTEE